MSQPVFEIQSLEEKDGLLRSLSLSVPAGEVGAQLSRRLKKRQKSVKLPGFRPGKAPMAIIERNYREQELQQAIRELAQQACLAAVDERQLDLATQLRIVQLSGGIDGTDIAAQVEFEVYPEVNLSPPEKMVVEKPAFSIEKADIEAMLENWRRQAVQYQPAESDAVAAPGDRLKLKIWMRAAEQQEGAANSPQETYALVGGNHFPAEVEAALPGLKVADETEVDAAVPMPPAARDQAQQAGDTASADRQTLHYRLQVLELAHPRYPSLEEMAQSIQAEGPAEGQNAGPTEGQIAGPAEGGKKPMTLLRERCRQQIEAGCAEVISGRTRQALYDQLTASNDVPLPQALVDAETDTLKTAMAPRLGIKPEEIAGAALEGIENQARKRVHLSVLLRVLGRVYDISPSSEDLQQVIGREAMQYPQPQEFVQWALGNQDYLRQARARAFEQLAADRLMEKVKVVEKSVPARELLGLTTETHGAQAPADPADN